jgi:hypothetical protein
MAHDVFISYSNKDKPSADAACALLEARGIRCWIAPRDILPGADWGESILDALGGARVFVLVFSSHANTSQQIKREVERAVNLGIPVIPVRIENVAPARSLEYFISTPHWLDAFTPPLEQHLNYLAEVIGHILDAGKAPPPRPVAGAVPASLRRGWPASLGLGGSKWRLVLSLSVSAVALVLVAIPVARLLQSPGATTSLPTSVGLSPAPAPPRDPKQVKLDFNTIDTISAPHYTVAAEPFLHEAPVSMAVTAKSPATSQIIFRNNLALYDGRAVAPTVSQNFLTQTGVGHGAGSFTITFSQPVAQVSFMVPKVFPDTPSGVTFPAWTATALDSHGGVLSSRSEQLVRRMPGSDFPAQTYTLDAPGFEGISAVRFDSDFRLNGVPFAGFEAILIEQIALERR